MVRRQEAAAALATVGIAVEPPWAPGMVVLNEAHPKLDEMFAGSEWADGKWRQTLLKLPGARRLEKPRLIGGVVGPQLAIPVAVALKIGIGGKKGAT